MEHLESENGDAALSFPPMSPNAAQRSLVNLIRSVFLSNPQNRSRIPLIVTDQTTTSDLSSAGSTPPTMSPRMLPERKRKMIELQDFKDQWGLRDMNLAQLKQICRSTDLNVSGRKQDLIERILKGKQTSSKKKSESPTKKYKKQLNGSNELIPWMSCLPSEIQSFILSMLPTIELLTSIPFVCKSWYRLTQKDHPYSVWRFIKSLDLLEIPRLSSTRLFSLLSLGGQLNLRSKILSKPFSLESPNGNLSSASLYTLTSPIHTLKLGEIDDDALAGLSAACPRLEHLEISVGILSRSPTFSFASIKYLSLTFTIVGFQPGKLIPSLKDCPNLKHLRIRDSVRTPYRWVTSVMQKSTECQSLETLELIDWQKDDYWTESWPNLKTLRFYCTDSSRSELSDAYFLAQKVPSLVCLEVRECVMKPATFDYFIRQCPALQRIACYDCKIDHEGWLTTRSTRYDFSGSNLAELSFEGCDLHPEHIFAFGRLKSVNLSYTNVNDHMIQTCQENSSDCPSLEVLNLRGCPDVKSPRINMNNLRYLDLSDTNITKESVRRILKSNPQLKVVKISNCVEVLKPRTLASLRSKFTNIEIIE